jgi:hypothetical protein
MAITPLPTPPSRDDPTNFATRADAFLGALPDFATEANALAVDVNADAVSASADAASASASAAGATAAANVTKWISGTTYTEGAVVWSPVTYLTYRRKSTGGGTTDPNADTTNWAQAAGTGDVTLTATQTLTNKTLTSPTLTSPTMTTPALGTPASGTLSSCTVDGTDAVGFRNIPQNAQTGNYTAVLADSGKHIYHAVGAGAATYTIPANGSVAYPIGTAITFINLSSTSISIAITTDTMYLSNAGTTGTRTLSQYGSATAIKVTSTVWLISGSGLT